jgi:hypothetical protein
MYATPTYDQFGSMIADFGAAYIDPAYKRMKAGVEYTQPTDSQFAAIFYGFIEISDTLESLSLSERLIGVSPPRAKGIDKDKYLKLLVGTYLQEIYILEQRLTAYAKKISRLYGKKGLPPAVQRVVYEPLEGIIGTRGSHVHNRRFSDRHLDSVSTLALFRRIGHQFGDDLDFEYKIAQREWKKKTMKNNVEIHRILEQYFRLLQIVMTSNDKIIFPTSGSEASAA